jgi:hypothetical protein
MDVRLEGWTMSVEGLFMDALDQMYYQDLRMVPIGTGPDGRVIYDHITTVTPAKVRPTGLGDIILRNADKGRGDYFIFGLSKTHEFDEGDGEAFFNFGYVYSNVDDMGGFTSSVAGSNFQAPVRYAGMNEPEVGRSDYERTHVFKSQVSLGYKLFGFLDSRFRLSGQHMSGQGISYTFSGNPFVDNVVPGTTTYNDNQPNNKALLYIPTAVNGQVCSNGTTGFDTRVVFNMSNAQCTAFNDFLTSTGLIDYAGRAAPRNGINGPWITRIDMGFEQEVKVFDDHAVTFEFNLFNVGNLINKKWGLYQTPVFQNFQSVVAANYDRETNRFIYNSFTAGNGLQTNTSASQWQLQIGARYEF